MRWWQRRPLTRLKFEAQYAERSGVTVEQLRSWYLFANICDCGEEYCTGWQMEHLEFESPDNRG
jgi:hypothetical protein